MNRWCKVVSPRFDYILGPTRMLSGKKDDILYLPRDILDMGVLQGDLERLPSRPEGYQVDKSGRVVKCS